MSNIASRAAMRLGVVSVFLLQGSVLAQESSAGDLEEVVVTGSRIARDDLNSVGPVTIMTAPEIAATGVTSLEVLLQRLPSSAGFGGNQGGWWQWWRSSSGRGVGALRGPRVGSDAAEESAEARQSWCRSVCGVGGGVGGRAGGGWVEK